ncbi:MAG: ABC transporter permease subunit, partial [Bacteroidia bacterium]|nr:ABC transporter permease subunit [Bacteroidia bacterium]
MKNLKLFTIILFTIIAVQLNAQAYKNFKVAVYCRAYEVEKMADPKWLTSVWDTLSHQLHVDRIYLETHRDLLIVPDATLEAAKKFFQSKGVEVAGGITYTIDESNNFQTFCYTNPENRQKVKEIAEHTAKHFDFFILDDFFFTSCKCDLCVAAKGEKSWTDFRLELMKNAASDLVINPAKKVNPKVQVIIKYPNWYEHFQGLGFNLEAGPVQFDGVYTGTETRDRSGNQHLQQYLGYAVFRYYENLKPTKNFGGWVDTCLMRFVDLFNCLPFYPIVMIIGAVMDQMEIDPLPRIFILMAVLGVLGWTGVARTVRGQILSLREQDFMIANPDIARIILGLRGHDIFGQIHQHRAG